MTLTSGPKSFGKLNVMAMVRKLIDEEAPILTLRGAPVSGVSGSFADYPVGGGALLVDVENSTLYINKGVTGNPIWSEVPDEGSGSDGLGVMRVAKANFDEDLDVTVVGTHPFKNRLTGDDLAIPTGSIILFGVINTAVAIVGGGAGNLSLSIQGTVVQNPIAYSLQPWIVGTWNASEMDSWLAASFVISTTGILQYNIAVFPILDGFFDVYYFYLAP